MPSAEEKNRRKAIRDNLREAEKDAIRASLPCAPAEMEALFDFVGSRLAENDCDNTPRYASEFIAKSNLNATSVISWLEDAGGYCDCEILANAEEKFRIAFPNE